MRTVGPADLTKVAPNKHQRNDSDKPIGQRYDGIINKGGIGPAEALTAARRYPEHEQKISNKITDAQRSEVVKCQQVNPIIGQHWLVVAGAKIRIQRDPEAHHHQNPVDEVEPKVGERDANFVDVSHE